MYNLDFMPERRTSGAYQLDVFLAGDANGDLKVGDDDIQAIEQLFGKRVGAPDYSVLADANRNGVINRVDRDAAVAKISERLLGSPCRTILSNRHCQRVP